MRQKKILVADDDPDIILALRMRLEDAGYLVVTASNGREAIDVIRSEKPDLALLDVIMPEGNAFAVMDGLREDERQQLPVVFLTADTQEVSQIKAFNRGIRHYLTKPCDAQTLLILVESALADVEGKTA